MDPRTITVGGVGRAARPADQAEARLGVEISRPTATEARRDAARVLDAVLVAIAAAGAAPDEVRTAHVALHPAWEHDRDGRSRLVGHQLVNQVIVTVRRLDELGRIVDGAIGAGATTVESVSFGLADERPLRREALQAAVDDARDKAGVLAAAAGVRLGGVVSIAEDGARPAPPVPLPMMRMEAAAADTPMLPGDVEVSAHVTIVFALESA